MVRLLFASFDQFGNDCFLDDFESFRIAKEAGHFNQKCFDELVDFVGVCAKVICIIAKTGVVSNRHSPANAAQDRG